MSPFFLVKITPPSTLTQRWQWHPTLVLLPGKSHVRRSLVGCSPWGVWESDTTEQLHFHFSLSCIGEGNGNPLQCSCLENPRDRRAWWAAIYGVTESRTRLKQLSSNSSSQHSHIYIHKKILILSGDPRSSFYLQPSFPSLLLGMCFWRFPGEQPQLPPLNSIGCCWMGKFLGSKHSRLSF